MRCSSSAAWATAASRFPASRSTSDRATIRNDRGRVLDDGGSSSPASTAPAGSSAARRGVIGTNKKDATETIELLLEDAAVGRLTRAPEPSAEAVERCSPSAAQTSSTYTGWEAIDEHERSGGEAHGRPRVKLATWDELLDASRGVTAATEP